MPSGPDFPYDLKIITKECILALFWPKKKVIEFFETSGCSTSDLAIVKSNTWDHLKRAEIIEAVFFRLKERPDCGYTVFHSMLGRLAEWSYFDPFWFEREKKLDRAHADERLATLRKMLAARYAETAAQKAAATKASAAEDTAQTLSGLLNDFRQLAAGTIKPQERGRQFERFLKRLFDQQGVGMSANFRLIGEEIDGSFKFEGENYIVEAKWQEASISTDALYKFAMKADGKMYGRGVFISVNAYSREGIRAIVTGKYIKTILIDGEDIVLVLEGHISLSAMLDAKIRAAQTKGEVYLHPLRLTSKI